MSDTRRSSDRTVEVAALFDGSRLTLARHLAGLRKSDLAAKIDKSATAVSAWEAGTKRPSSGAVAELAVALSVDPGFFSARPDDIGALSTVPHFRSLRSTSQLARDQAFAYGRLAVDIASSLERHVELPQIDVPRLTMSLDESDDDGPERAAQLVRQAWALAEGPLPHLVRLIERHGVLIVFSPAGTSAVDAYSFDTKLRPVVILNPIKRDYYRQRFDVAHELGHIVMHADAEPGSRLVEEQANRFASEFLMPAAQIRDVLPASMGGNVWAHLAKLKEQWGVSLQALLFRSRRLGRLSDVSYRNAMVRISELGWRRDEPGLVTTMEQPSLLPRAVQLLADAGIEEGDLLAQCRVPVELFRRVIARFPEDVAPRPVAPPPTQSKAKVVSLLGRSQSR